MLGYLDALIAALSVRDETEATRLLRHPLARLLPEEVRSEATAFSAGACDGLAAPLRTMRLRHQTAELLREGAPLADQPEPSVPADVELTGPVRAPQRRRSRRPQQMELPLSA